MSEQTSLRELFETDPLKLSDVDFDRIVSEIRKQRHVFIQTDDKKIGAPASRKSETQKAKEKNLAVDPSIDLDDLLKDL